MPINDFKVFAGGSGADVVSQASYEALSALVNGFSTGTAVSSQLNKVWRQSSIMSAVLAQFIVARTGLNTLDDGTTTTLEANLEAAIVAMIGANAPTSIGRHTIWVPAAAIYSTLTNGAGFTTLETSANKVVTSALTYDPAVTQYGQFAVQMPKNWNEGSVTAVVDWSQPAGSGGVVWGLQGLARSDGDALEAGWSTAVTTTDTGGSADTLYRSPETAALSLAGTPIENDLALFQIYRDVANGADTLGVAARLHGLALFYTTNAGTDA